ncbi:CLC_0170 family protein [Brevibacillus fluminis]|uniref:CLC_0170 family protein n=1 Tax=Brevibacillus fluminis TaxID=511487 RepID=UPI003F8BBED1
MNFSLIIGFVESLTSYYLTFIFLVMGLLLRFRTYPAYKSRQLTMDAAWARIGGIVCMIVSGIVLVSHFLFI